MGNNQFNNITEFLKEIPIMAVPNFLKLTPAEHEGGIYYYGRKENFQGFKFCVNTKRRQWSADHGDHGDDALSLVEYLGRNGATVSNGADLVETFAHQIALEIKHDMDTPQRIPFKPLPLRSRKWVAKAYVNSINKPFVKGMSAAMLKKHCYVVYRANCPIGEEDKETMRLYALIRDTKDLRQLTVEDKKAIVERFTTAIALRNINGGLQLYTGEFTYPEKSQDYCLFGSDEVEPGEKLYVYENILDYLAMMEQRHKNGTEAIMPPAHHIIINGDENLKDALDYIHDRCEYLDVVCLFPNDAQGNDLFQKVLHATNDTAQDASQRMYANERYFSLYAKNADYRNPREVAEYERSMERTIDRELEQSRKQSDKSKQQESNWQKVKERVIPIPSAPKTRLLERANEVVKGLRI